jgi:hypothetical protein
MAEENIKGGFKGCGLLPLDPESVVSKFDVQLRTPTSPEGTPARLSLGVRRHHRLSVRLNLAQNILKSDLRNIKAAQQRRL